MRKIAAKFILINLLVILMTAFSGISGHAASLTSPQISGQSTYNTVTIQYASTDKVAGYEVSASVNNAAFKVIYTGTKTSTTMSSLAVGTTVTINVRSYVGSDSKKTYSAVSTLTLQTSLNAVVLKGSTSKGTNTLTWTSVKGASSYEVSSSSSYSGTYKVLGNVNTLSYKNKVGLKTAVYYKVRAYTTVKGVKVYAPDSNIIYLAS